MSSPAVICLGWSATAMFVASYFLVRPMALRTAQMLGALLWMIYGGLIGAPPVIVANALVIAAAAWSIVRALPRSGDEPISETRR
jgi:hypothetical protein